MVKQIIQISKIKYIPRRWYRKENLYIVNSVFKKNMIY